MEVRPFRVALGREHNDVYGQGTARREVSDRGCVLVRPDRFVAWRSDDLPDDPATALTDALVSILDR